MVILFDIFSLPENVLEIIFATKAQKIVGELLVKMMKENGGEITKSQMSHIATNLHEGKLVTEIDSPEYMGKKVKLSYNKRQFYDRILTPMKSMGLIYYDLYKKTYKLSGRFAKEMQNVGAMWEAELKKPVSAKVTETSENSSDSSLQI